MQGMQLGHIGGPATQTNQPRNGAEVHQDSLVGRSIIQLYNQLDDLQIAIGTLHDRMAPVLVILGPKVKAENSCCEIQVNSPMSTDMLALQNKVSMAAEQIHDLIHRLSI